MSKPRGHWLQWNGKAETREELSQRLNKLYFEPNCCCGERVDEGSILYLLRHIYHALRCRAGLCKWRPTT